jgi:hypothetical protein
MTSTHQATSAGIFRSKASSASNMDFAANGIVLQFVMKGL